MRHGKNDRACPTARSARSSQVTGVGGAGIHWSGVHSRVMPEELRLKSHVTERYGAQLHSRGHDLQDWGVTYDELGAPFRSLRICLRHLGPGRQHQGRKIPRRQPVRGARARANFRLPPLTDPPTSVLFAKATRELGYHPYALPAANASRSYTNPYGCQLGPCNFCGFCSDYGCINYSKASPQTTILPTLYRMPNFALRTNAHVTKVNTDSTGKEGDWRHLYRRPGTRGRAAGGDGRTGRVSSAQCPADAVVSGSASPTIPTPERASSAETSATS